MLNRRQAYASCLLSGIEFAMDSFVLTEQKDSCRSVSAHYKGELLADIWADAGRSMEFTVYAESWDAIPVSQRDLKTAFRHVRGHPEMLEPRIHDWRIRDER